MTVSLHKIDFFLNCPGQSMSNWTKKMKKWKSPSPILMKLGTIDVLYVSMKWPNFEVAVTSRGLSSSVSIFGLEAIKPNFRRLYLPCFSRYLKNSNALFFTASRTPILIFWLFWSEAVQISTLWPLIFDLDYLKTRILRFFSYFCIRKSQIYNVRCKRNFFGYLLVKGTIVD